MQPKERRVVLMQVFSRLVGENAPAAGEKPLQPSAVTTKIASEKNLGRHLSVDFTIAFAIACGANTYKFMSTVSISKSGKFGFLTKVAVMAIVSVQFACYT